MLDLQFGSAVGKIELVKCEEMIKKEKCLKGKIESGTISENNRGVVSSLLDMIIECSNMQTHLAEKIIAMDRALFNFAKIVGQQEIKIEALEIRK